MRMNAKYAQLEADAGQAHDEVYDAREEDDIRRTRFAVRPSTVSTIRSTGESCAAWLWEAFPQPL
jgi:hypothetical protein